MIPAFKKDIALIEEMDALMQQSGFHLWWLGQSGYLLQWNGKRVLIDPYLSDALTTKYAQTDKPHIRMSERVVEPNMLWSISIVSSSHNHTDHLDAETLVPVIQNNPGINVLIPEANRAFVADRLKCDPGFLVGLTEGESATFEEISFTGIPSKHNEIERDVQGNCLYMGYVIRFGNYAVYHSGDTLWYDELPQILRPFKVDVALLPINGNKPERRVAGNLDSAEAVKLGRAIGAKFVIPCHYDMFQFNTADVQEFADKALKAEQPFVILRGGERFSFQ